MQYHFVFVEFDDFFTGKKRLFFIRGAIKNGKSMEAEDCDRDKNFC
jgi:hypothetical protein